MRAAATWGISWFGVLGMVGMVGIARPAWATPPSEQPAVDPISTPEPVPWPEAEAAIEPPPEPEPALEPIPEPQLPAYDQPLPSYDDVPIAPDVSFDGAPIEIEIEVPPTGRGHTAVGSILLGGGAVLTGVSATMIGEAIDVPVWLPGAVLGSTAVIAGVSLIITGHFRQKTHRRWVSNHIDGRMPPRGDGLLAGGLTCMIAGVTGAIIGGASIIAFQSDEDPPYGQVMLPLGLASMGTGIGLVAAGSARRKQLDRWQAGLVLPSLSLLPGTRQSIGGVSLGFAGRF
jgi:hypothetical protein